MVDSARDDANGGFRRVEILAEPARRRRWSAEDKARIVAETLAPGAPVFEGCPALAGLFSAGIRLAMCGMPLREDRPRETGAIASEFAPIVTGAFAVSAVPPASASVRRVALQQPAKSPR